MFLFGSVTTVLTTTVVPQQAKRGFKLTGSRQPGEAGAT